MPRPFRLRAEVETSAALCDARGLYRDHNDNRWPKNRTEKRHSIASENHTGILSIQNEKMKQKDLYNLHHLRKEPEFILTQLQNELYRELNAYMQKNELSIKQLADKLGVSASYISQVLNGRFNFTVMKLVELSLAIDKVPVIRLEEPRMGQQKQGAAK
jgi:predicted XRE-type DNA-binding protein